MHRLLLGAVVLALVSACSSSSSPTAPTRPRFDKCPTSTQGSQVCLPSDSGGP